jgi:hypothetical protein
MAALTLAGHEAPLVAALTCAPRATGEEGLCKLHTVRWDMRRHALAPPHFLGLTVDPLIELDARFVLHRSLRPTHTGSTNGWSGAASPAS